MMDTFEEAFQEMPTSSLIEKTSFMTIRSIRQKTSTLYSSILDINQQKKMGKNALPIAREQEDYEDIKIIKMIGKGGFSEVFQAVNQKTGKEFALRLCEIDHRNYTHNRAIKEIEVYNQLRVIEHPNIANVYTAKIISSSAGETEEISLQVIMELGICTLEDVFIKRIREKKPWTELEILKISTMMIDAMRVTRQYGLSHRDLSLNNIILGQDLKDYKLIDFAEAKTFNDNVSQIPIVGKYRYLAPEIKEIIDRKNNGEDIPVHYDTELSDVYSLGIIFGSLSILELFDSRDTDDEWKRKLIKLRDLNPKMHSLVLDMIAPKPHQRKRFSELLKDLIGTNPAISQTQFCELEFDSSLKNTKMENTIGISNTYSSKISVTSFEKKFRFFMKKGDNNMRNNSYGEAILAYLKVYEILKRGQLPISREEMFKRLIQLSLKISGCQTHLLNYEEAAVVLRTSLKNLGKKFRREDGDGYLELYLKCSIEYAKLSILRYKLPEAHDIVSDAVEKVNYSKSSPSDHLKLMTSLICIKSEILLKLGYIEDSYKMLEKVKKLYGGSSKNSGNLRTIEKIGYVTCDLNLARIEIELSRFRKGWMLIQDSEEIVEQIFTVGDNELGVKTQLLKLLMAREVMDFKERAKYAEILAESYSNFDHFRLMKSNEFIEFVKERILYLIDNTRFDSALNRVDNVLEILNEKINFYWYNQFLLLKSMCLHGLRKYMESYKLLKSLLPLVMEPKIKLKDYRMLVDLHIQLALNYFAREDYKNSLKCLKYILIEYYENDKILGNQESREQLQVCSIYSQMSNIYRKMSNFKKAFSYIEKGFEICQKVFSNNPRNLNFCSLYVTRGKIYCEIDEFTKAEGDFNMAQMIYKTHLDYGEFCSLRYGLLYKELGNIHVRNNNFQKGLQFYKEALKTLESLYPDMVHKSASATLNDIASICIKFKKFDLAKTYLEKALEINKAIICGSESVEISTNYHTYGNYYMKQGKYDKALEYFKIAKKIAMNCLNGIVNVDVARTLFQMGMAYKKKKELNTARDKFKEAKKIFEAVFREMDSKNVSAQKCQKQIRSVDEMTSRREVMELIEEQKRN